MTAGRKLTLAGFVVATATGYMAYLGASSSWQYYVTVDECLANPSAFCQDRLRVLGRISPRSLHLRPDGCQASFALEGATGRLSVSCRGPFPDRLAEGMDVVVEGRLDRSGLFHGDRLLARCASKYESETRPVRSPPAKGGA
jgi:cytochrome c-type biogenesis protein CcmE